MTERADEFEDQIAALEGAMASAGEMTKALKDGLDEAGRAMVATGEQTKLLSRGQGSGFCWTRKLRTSRSCSRCSRTRPECRFSALWQVRNSAFATWQRFLA